MRQNSFWLSTKVSGKTESNSVPKLRYLLFSKNDVGIFMNVIKHLSVLK